MNHTIQELRQRKSVRAYEERDIGPEEKRLILDAALQAPTAGNMTLYTILDITDQAVKDKLAESCDHQPFIAQAKLLLIFCADCQRWYDLFCRHVSPVREPGEGDLFLAQADALIAAQNAVVAAESLGIGSCYIGDITERFEYHRELLRLPRYVVPACMLCFGYPTEQQRRRPKPPRFAIGDVVCENAYESGRASAFEDMLLRRGEAEAAGFSEWVNRFCLRKWNAGFSREMTRSCAAMLRSWCTGREK